MVAMASSTPARAGIDGIDAVTVLMRDGIDACRY
jgi:hypothetical protein